MIDERLKGRWKAKLKSKVCVMEEDEKQEWNVKDKK
jgi:hypothetical protein